jgi:tetraacyldisaccharide 4'-kinase
MKPPRAPDFWWRRHSLAGYALAPIGAAYGRISGRRMSGTGVSVGIPVICVGNLVLGGAGKTPTALAVADVCQSLGHRPGFLSRGYRGRESGPVVVFPAAHTAVDVGDEALLLAQHGPTVVSIDRPTGARLLARLGVDVVVMDDGFQNPTLAKDLSIIVIDAARGTGNGLVFPAGPLRAPLLSQVRHADALVMLGKGPTNGASGQGVRIAARAGIPVLHAQTEAARKRGLRRKPYLAFAGIADPRKFYATLAEAGATIGHLIDFPDHHMFSEAECEMILREAAQRDLVPITTEKDRARLIGRSGSAQRLAAATEVLPVKVRFEEPRRLAALVADAIEGFDSAYRRGRISSTPAVPVPA